MAQINEIQEFERRTVILRASNAAVAVAQAGNTTLLELDTRMIERLFVQFAVADQALDAFIVQVLAHGNGAYQSIASAAGDYTSPAGLLVAVGGGSANDLTITPAAGSGWFLLDVRGIARVKVLASSANVAGSAVTIYAGGQ